MSITLRIWLTVALIVMIFAVLVLYIVPNQQEKYFMQTFNKEVHNLAKTVALGSQIALDEQNLEGVEMAIDFAKADSRLEFVALIQTVGEVEVGSVEGTAFVTYPPDYPLDLNRTSSDSLIVKHAPIKSKSMNGDIMVGFKTNEIVKNMNRIRRIAILVSLVVFAIGILLGLWLANTISKPVREIRDAALKVGKGDLTQHVGEKSQDELGELSRAFNKMVDDLAKAEERIHEKNKALLDAMEKLANKEGLGYVDKTISKDGDSPEPKQPEDNQDAV